MSVLYRILALCALVIPSYGMAQPIPSSGSNYNFGFTFPSVPAGTTAFVMTEAQGNGNIAAITSVQTTFSSLQIRIANAPAAAQQDVFTIATGNPGGTLSPTSVTCTVAAASTTCNDTTHSVVVAAGQAWAIQVITGATNATAQGQAGVLMSN